MAKKGTSEKSTVSKKSAAPTARDELAKQLTKIVKELKNENSFTFLIKQALVLKHNEQIEEINQSVKTLKTGEKGKPTPVKNARPGTDKHSIEIIEADNGSSFVLVVNNCRNFFARDEMKKIVKLCHAASDSKDASERLYNWFGRERSDVINNSKIDGPGDLTLETIYNEVIKTYTVKG